VIIIVALGLLEGRHPLLGGVRPAVSAVGFLTPVRTTRARGIRGLPGGTIKVSALHAKACGRRGAIPRGDRRQEPPVAASGAGRGDAPSAKWRP
jgi:hypothetical protein